MPLRERVLAAQQREEAAKRSELAQGKITGAVERAVTRATRQTDFPGLMQQRNLQAFQFRSEAPRMPLTSRLEAAATRRAQEGRKAAPDVVKRPTVKVPGKRRVQ